MPEMDNRKGAIPMNESNNQIQKTSEATRALQGVAEDMERERADRGRADSDPRGESEGRAVADATASREDRAPGAPAVTGRDETGVQDALRPVPVQARNPH